MPAALPLSTAISQTSESTRDYRVLEMHYGNGYSQRAADGLNSVIDSWNVTWENISATDFNTVMTALDAAKGTDYFTWTAPGDSTSKKWIVSQVSRRMLSGSIYSVSATLKQVFDL